MLKIDELKFDAQGLIPAIVVDASSKKVLTLAYMNRESLEISMREGRTCFWSRSRQELWRKGETSGNVQRIVSITADCDRDALVVTVDKDGPACHLGTDSCFQDSVFESGQPLPFSVEGLYTLLQGRKESLPEGSYTTYLFQKGIDKILKRWVRNPPRSLSPAKLETSRKPSTKSRIDVSCDGTDGGNGHFCGGCDGRTGLPACDRP